jgi:hypothetical protein
LHILRRLPHPAVAAATIAPAVSTTIAVSTVSAASLVTTAAAERGHGVLVGAR